MSRLYRMRLATLAAIVGGLLQIGVLGSQVNQLRLEAEVQYDRQGMNWNVPWGDRWFVVGTWLFFLGTIVALQWYTTRRFGQPGRKGLLSIIGILAIFLAESTMLLATDPWCYIHRPCPSPLFANVNDYTNLNILVFRLGVLATLCLCGSLFSSSFFLWLLPHARRWGLLFFGLGLLVMPAWIVIGGATNGFFQMDTLIMVQEFLRVLIWLVAGIALWRVAPTVNGLPYAPSHVTHEKTVG